MFWTWDFVIIARTEWQKALFRLFVLVDSLDSHRWWLPSAYRIRSKGLSVAFKALFNVVQWFQAHWLATSEHMAEALVIHSLQLTDSWTVTALSHLYATAADSPCLTLPSIHHLSTPSAPFNWHLPPSKNSAQMSPSLWPFAQFIQAIATTLPCFPSWHFCITRCQDSQHFIPQSFLMSLSFELVLLVLRAGPVPISPHKFSEPPQGMPGKHFIPILLLTIPTANIGNRWVMPELGPHWQKGKNANFRIRHIWFLCCNQSNSPFIYL